MTTHDPSDRDRLFELLADRATRGITPEDEAELTARLADADDNAERDQEALIAAMILAVDDPAEGGMPTDVRARLAQRGAALAAGVSSSARTPGRSPWMALAAVIALAGVMVAVLSVALQQRSSSLRHAETTLVELRERIESNEALLATARTRADALSGELAEAAQRETALAARLASATSDLDDARLAIARFEQPDDPAELAADRRLLLSLDGTFRVSWQPFDLPDAPAEQQSVRGDVTWNDELQQGYLRFVGLEVNDPEVEQYQVWVIDERGMEQKVSGGVFNATAEGEVIVPIKPGIDVGRVALFAITIENPGGTWVPDLSRRVVVGAREGG